MNIPFYTLDEKKQVFKDQLIKIESADDFNKWVWQHQCTIQQNQEGFLAYIDNNKKRSNRDLFNNYEPLFVYRGLNNAAYKNFTSAQRRLFLNDYNEADFVHLINDEIQSLKVNEKYCNYLSEHQLQFDEWHALSYLQHYEGDTPCLDFTKDFYMALFFATNQASPSNDNPLSQYISLYYMIYPWEFDIYRMFELGAQNADKSIAEYYGPYTIDYSETRKLLRTMPFYHLFSAHKGKKCPYMAIDNKVWLMDAPHIDINEQHAISNNNIVNQNGCFAVNFSINCPYEPGKLQCVDINKKIIPHIESILKSRGIDETKVYSNDGNREIVCAIRDATNNRITGNKQNTCLLAK